MNMDGEGEGKKKKKKHSRVKPSYQKDKSFVLRGKKRRLNSIVPSAALMLHRDYIKHLNQLYLYYSSPCKE